MSHDGETFGLRLGERCVGGDDGDGGALAQVRLRLVPQPCRAVRQRCWQAEAAELVTFLERCGPEMATVADGRLADGVDGNEGGDGHAAGEPHRRRAEAALEAGGGGAGSGADRAEGEGFAGGVVGRPAKGGVGRCVAPRLVAAVEEIEQDRRRHDRHLGGADRVAAAGCGEGRHHAGGRVEAEGGAAGQDNCVDGLDRVLRRQQIGFAGARRAAHDVDGGHGRCLADDNGDARLQRRVVGVADAEAGNVGDQIAKGLVHDRPLHLQIVVAAVSPFVEDEAGQIDVTFLVERNLAEDGLEPALGQGLDDRVERG